MKRPQQLIAGLTLGLSTLAWAQSGIRGVVSDGKSKETLIEATVKVVSPGAEAQVLTDVDGNYMLSLPPGTYDLRIFYELYQGRRIGNVQVKEGAFTELNVQLFADAGSVQEVVVEARADKRAEAAVLAERKKAAVVSDAISAQEISRTPDSNASDAVKRVVSATIVDGKFVLLRGLGGRYSTTLLNGAPLPSPEPDEPSVPLDLFPTSLLSNLNVVKSYTAELPGTFAGGALLIETNSYPTTLEIRPRVSLSGDNLATFRDRRSQFATFGENFGFASSSRNLPSAIPTDGPLRPRAGFSASQVESAAESFRNEWTTASSQAMPNGSFSLSVGDTLKLGPRKLGYLTGISYNRSERVQTADLANVTNDSGGLIFQEPAVAELGLLTANLSGLFNLGLKVNERNEVTLLSLYTQGTESRSQFIDGFADNDNEYYEGTRLQFISRVLSFNQLRGSHRFDAAELEWQGNFSRVERSEPDTRDLTYNINEHGQARFRNDPGSGDRFFSELGENSTGGSVHVTFPLDSLKLKAGGMTQLSFRAFDARRFRFVYEGGNNAALFLPPEELFTPTYIGGPIGVTETTLPTDTYSAFLGIYAGYASAEYVPTKKLRLLGGLRYEMSQQNLSAQSPYSVTRTRPEGNEQTYQDLLPTANVIYDLTDKWKLRGGYSFTLARPTFRELAPFLFYDFVRRRAVSGNPDLLETRVHNADVRLEYYASESDVVAASVFTKRFLDPIERVIVSVGSGDLSFRNAEAATVLGAEFEARTSLGRLVPLLRNFRAAANLTLIQSSVELGANAGAQTNQARPLQGQSPYVVNVSLGYEREKSGTEIAVLYNVYGPRISEVGFETLPDVYEQAFHRVDLTFSQKLSGGFQLKLTGANLFDSALVFKQGPYDVLKFRPGLSLSASLAWSI